MSKVDEVVHQANKYYDFTFHEMGVFDLPALWNMIQKETHI